MKVVPLPKKYGQRIGLRLARQDRVQRSPYGQIQRERMPGEHWLADITWPALGDEDRREVSSWLVTAARGNVLTTVDPTRGIAISGYTELLSNPDFASGTTGWSATAAALSASIRRLRVQANSASAAIAYQSVSLTAGRRYLLLVHAMDGSHNLFRSEIYDTVAAGSLVSMDTVTDGLLAIQQVAASTGAHHIRLTSRAAASGDHLFYSGASLARCAVVDGAGQTGRRLHISGLDASASGILQPDDYVAILTDMTTSMVNPKIELKRLTAALNSDSGGEGDLYFEPALRNSPNDGAPVMFYRPRFYGYFPEPSPAFELTRPMIGALSVTLEEDILAP